MHNRSKQLFAGLRRQLPLILVLAAALALRVLFSPGFVDVGDLHDLEIVAIAARSLREGTGSLGDVFQQLRLDVGGFRELALFLPHLVTFYALGTTFFLSLAVPILASVATVYLVYCIAIQLTSNRNIGLFAALLWAFFPVEIFYASSLVTTSPLVLLFLFGIHTLLRGVKESKWWLIGSAFSLVALFGWDAWLAASFAAVASYLFFVPRSDPKPWRLLLALQVLVLLFAWRQLGQAFLDFYTFLRSQEEMVLFLPLFFVSTTVYLLRKEKPVGLLLAWSGSVLAVILSKSVFSASPSTEYTLSPFLLLFLCPLVIQGAGYLQSCFDQEQAGIAAGLLALLGGIAAWLASLGARTFLPPNEALATITLPSLFMLFYIFSGLAFAGILASPYLLTGRANVWKSVGMLLLCGLFVLATLPFSWAKRAQVNYLNESTLGLLGSTTDWVPPFYTLNAETNQRIRYFMQMDDINAGNLPADGSVAVLPLEQFAELSTGTVFAFEDDPLPVPVTWWKMAGFGAPGTPRLAVYRVYDDASNSEDAYGPLLNAGDFCAAYQAWTEGISDSAVMTTPYNPSANCLRMGENLVSLTDLTKAGNIDGYIIFSDRVPSTELSVLNMSQSTLPIYDQRTATVRVTMQPNTLYLYSIELMAPAPTITLFWRSGQQLDYLEMKSYPEWTSVSMLLMTPNWSGPQIVSFSPVLFDHLETVSLRNFFVGAVELTTTQ